MTDLARFTVEPGEAVAILRVDGEVDMSNAEELAAAMDQAAGKGSTVALDLSGTTYLDSAGIRLLFNLAKRLQTQRRRVRVIVPEDSPIRAVLEITGVPLLVPLETGLDRAQPGRLEGRSEASSPSA